MSAYMVSKEQIHVMLWAATRYSDSHGFIFPSSYGMRWITSLEDKTAMGQELLDANAFALVDL